MAKRARTTKALPRAIYGQQYTRRGNLVILDGQAGVADWRLLVEWATVIFVAAVATTMASKWVPPDWRQQLFIGLFIAAVIGVVTMIASDSLHARIHKWWVEYPVLTVYIAAMLSAGIGALLFWLYASSPPQKEDNPFPFAIAQLAEAIDSDSR